ncbi:16387_t:CDS:1, partial [Racocetra persica]
MNFQILNLFVIVFSILLTLTITITVDARFNEHIKNHANKRIAPPAKLVVGSDPCAGPGSQAWNDKMLFMRGIEKNGIDDASKCCGACNSDPNCISWSYFPARKICYFAYNPNNGTDFCSSNCFAVPSKLDFDG